MQLLDAPFAELSSSCKNGAVRKVEIILLEHPSLIHSYNPFLETPLHIAANYGHANICSLLLRKNANPLATTSEGWNALHYASRSNQVVVIEQLVSEKIIQVNSKTNLGETPLFLSFDFCKYEAAFTLIELGADLSIPDSNNDTPFSLMTTENNLHRKFLSELITLSFARKSTIVIKEIFIHKQVNGILDLSHMDIDHFPDEAGQILQTLPHIIELNLSYNKLNIFPYSLKVENVNVDHNPRDAIPEGFRKSWEKVQGYLNSVKNRATKWTECKLLFVGQEGVGKTTLLNVFKSKSGKVSCKSNLSTNGINITSGVNFNPDDDKKKSILSSGNKKKKKNGIQFNCWDLGGQEVFYPTHQFFLTCNSVYILAFDASKPGQSRVEYWMRQIRNLTNNSTKAPVFLVGTHIDKPNCTPEFLKIVNSTFTKSYPKSRFRGIQGVYFISSKTGAGITELKSKIYSVVTGKNFQPYISPSWVRLHDLIKTTKMEKDIIEWSEYSRLGKFSDIDSDSELNLATEFLSGVGSLIHFQDKNEDLNNLIILNPQWLADVMSSLITFKHKWIKDGMLSLSAIPQVFKSYKSSLHNTLLALLERFSIIHILSPKNCSFITEDKIIVSSMLPEDIPENINEAWPKEIPNGQIQQGKLYTFPFLPLGFFNRLMIRLLHIPNLTGNLFWRNGMTITYGTQTAFLHFIPDKAEFLFIVRTPASNLRNRFLRDTTSFAKDGLRENLLIRLIGDGIDTLIESYRMGNIQRLIACSHCYNKGLDVPYYFTYLECVDAITNGISNLYCNNIKQKGNIVPIETIAPDIAFADIPLINSADLVIGKELGRGAFGIVYYAEWIGTPVAVKQLSSAYMDDELFTEFQQEVFIMSQLQCDYLVSLKGVSTIPKLMMILEFLPGGDLYQLLHPNADDKLNFNISTQISKDKFPWSLRLLLALDIAKGLQYLQLQSPPIVHRDLRSPNIFIDTLSESATVRAKVADFGLARTVAPQVYGALNTWQWIAPEAIFDGKFDIRSDIYSLGICFWEIASRSHPFDEYIYNTNYSIDIPGGDRIIDEIKVKRAITNDDLRPSLPGDDENCPKEFVELIKNCWKTNPKERIEIQEIINILSNLTNTEILSTDKILSPRIEDEIIEITDSNPLIIELDVEAIRAESEINNENWITSPRMRNTLKPLISPTILEKLVNTNTTDVQENNETKSSDEKTVEISIEEKDKMVDLTNYKTYTFYKGDSIVKHNISSICTNKNYDYIWMGTTSGKVLVYSKNGMNHINEWNAHDAIITNLICVTPRILRTRLLWTGDSLGILRIWDEEVALMKQEWKPFSRKCNIDIFCRYIGKTSKIWIASTTEPVLSVLDTDTAQLLHKFKLDHFPTIITQVKDSIWLAIDTGEILVYNSSAVRLLSWQAHHNKITGICEGSNDLIWSSSNTGVISFWKFSNNKIEKFNTIKLGTSIRSLTSIPSINVIWVLHNTNIITIWNAEGCVPMDEIILQNMDNDDDNSVALILSVDNYLISKNGSKIINWEWKRNIDK